MNAPKLWLKKQYRIFPCCDVVTCSSNNNMIPVWPLKIWTYFREVGSTVLLCCKGFTSRCLALFNWCDIPDSVKNRPLHWIKTRLMRDFGSLLQPINAIILEENNFIQNNILKQSLVGRLQDGIIFAHPPALVPTWPSANNCLLMTHEALASTRTRVQNNTKITLMRKFCLPASGFG